MTIIARHQALLVAILFRVLRFPKLGWYPAEQAHWLVNGDDVGSEGPCEVSLNFQSSETPIHFHITKAIQDHPYSPVCFA